MILKDPDFFDTKMRIVFSEIYSHRQLSKQLLTLSLFFLLYFKTFKIFW